MDIKLEQLNILMQSIREIIKSNHCPDWIHNKLFSAIKKAKSLNPDNSKLQTTTKYIPDEKYYEFKIGDEVISSKDNYTCKYQIIDTSDPINNINLYTLKIIIGNEKNPTGSIIFNVPETFIQHILTQG